jgi:hypothetical protein
VNVQTGRNAPTIPELVEALPEDLEPYDRTQTNAWDDVEFGAAVAASTACGRYLSREFFRREGGR